MKFRISVHLITFSWCTFMAILYATAYYESLKLRHEDVQWTRELIYALLRWWPCMIEITFILWCSRLFPLKRPVKLLYIFGHLCASVLLGLADLRYDYFKYTHCMGYDVPAWFGFGSLMIECTYYWITLGFFLGIESYLKSRERAVHTSRLEAQLTRAQLQVMRMQFHPHFLFNTLHAAAALMHRDLDAAERMLSRLSELLRHSMDEVAPQEVTLKRELDTLRLYLEIERIRFGDRRQVNMDSSAESLDAFVPNLILLPLVEDAIHFGLSRVAGTGRIDLRSGRNEDTLWIEVWNNGSGQDIHDNETSARMGIDNVRARLLQLYGDGGKIDISTPESGGWTVQVRIPYHVTPSKYVPLWMKEYGQDQNRYRRRRTPGAGKNPHTARG